MKAVIKKQKAIRGFMPTTYAVFIGTELIKIFTDKKEAENFVKELNK